MGIVGCIGGGEEIMKNGGGWGGGGRLGQRLRGGSRGSEDPLHRHE